LEAKEALAHRRTRVKADMDMAAAVVLLNAYLLVRQARG
jgi:hypothetical protein